MNNDDPKSISLADMVTTAWQARWTVLAFILAGALCAAAWSMLRPVYLSTGYFRFEGTIPVVLDKEEVPPGILPGNFSRYALVMQSPDRLADFISANNLDAAPGIAELKKSFRSRARAARIIEPIYSFLRLDGTEIKGGSNSTILGLRISYQSAAPETARDMTSLLGRYAMDSIIFAIYRDVILTKDAELQARKVRLGNLIAQKDVQLEDLALKMRGVKEVIARYPSHGDKSTVVATEDTIDYLPPSLILTASEVQAAGVRQEIGRLKREQQQIAIQRQYYSQMKEELARVKSGEALLRALETTKESVFKKQNMDDVAVRHLFNIITDENQAAVTSYLHKSRFLDQPELPARPVNRLAPMLAGGIVAGLLIALLFVFGRQWWRRNMSGRAA